MKKLVLSTLILFCIHLLTRANEDSLLTVLSRVSEFEKAHVLNQLSVYHQEKDSARSMGYARQASAMAARSTNRVELCDAWFNMGECLYCCDEFVKAQIYYRRAFDMAKDLNDKNKMATILNASALTHYFRSEYDLAIEKQIEALRCLENTGDKMLLSRIYSNMGMVYSRIGEYRKSINYYKVATGILEREGSISGIKQDAINYNGIGVGYYNLGKMDSSRINYQIALKRFRLANDKEKTAITLNNIANTFVDQHDSLDKALEYFQQALDVFEELNDIRNATFVIESLGAAYLAMGDEPKALKTLQEGLELARKHRIGYYIQQNYYRDISGTYEKMGKISEAYAAYKMHRIYLDSLRQEERIRQVTELEKKFQTEKKEEEIRRLNIERKVVSLQMQKERTIRIFVTFLLLMTAGIAIYIAYAYYNKRKTNHVLKEKNGQIEYQRNELEKVNATKNKFFSILAHDLKNPFHTIMGYSSLLNQDYEKFTEDERKKYAGDIYKSANNIYRLLQNLLDWSRSQTGNLKYNPVRFELRPLSDAVFSLLSPLAGQKSIRLNNHVPKGVYLYADPMMVETILRNLMSNAIKFSYAEGQVSMRTKQDKTADVATFCISDQGQGLSTEELQQLFRIDSTVRKKGTKGEDGSGLGLALCKEFVQINNGAIHVESEPGKGSTFCVTLPAGKPHL
ncbi:MAG: tetratricopeptide repeat-containing sensor histidine kinase [Prolixibacteraceae bacterium]